MYKFRNWDFLEKRFLCEFNVFVSKSSTKDSSDDVNELYTIRVGDNSKGNTATQCISTNEFFEFTARTISDLTVSKYNESIQGFTLYSLVIMMVLLYNYDEEVDEFDRVFMNRYYAPETHGQQCVSYVSKYNYYVNQLTFFINFSIFMFYFQLSMIGVFKYGVLFQLPLLFQFMILFFYSNKHLNLHQRIRSMDLFPELF